MDWQTAILAFRHHVAVGEKLHCAWFSSSNTVPFARCLFVLIGRVQMAPERPQIDSLHVHLTHVYLKVI